jgi:DNA-binding XRE family transcriptional regulator
MKHDLLHIQGKPFVLVPLHEYRALTTTQGAETPAPEDLPADVLDALTARQESALRILRKHRGLTQQELADAAGLSRPYLTEMEKGRKAGSVRALRSVAQTLDVDMRHLVG